MPLPSPQSSSPMSKQRLIFALLLTCLTSSPLLASAASKTPQQQRMADCAAQNKGKTGDDYKNAQKRCMAGTDKKPASSSTQRMKDCNAKATGKKGDARKSFMNTCLKAD
jgi:hypothetical protein